MSLHHLVLETLIIKVLPGACKCNGFLHSCYNEDWESFKKCSKVDIQLVCCPIIPCHSYRSSGFRNVLLRDTFPTIDLPGCLPKYGI